MEQSSSFVETMPSNGPPEPENRIEILETITEKLEPCVSPISPPPSSHNSSRESLVTPSKQHDSPESPLRRIRRVTATPLTQASESRSMSEAPNLRREKSPISLSSLSDYDGSEASHTERRFLRLYEELEAHCSGNEFLSFLV